MESCTDFIKNPCSIAATSHVTADQLKGIMLRSTKKELICVYGHSAASGQAATKWKTRGPFRDFVVQKFHLR